MAGSLIPSLLALRLSATGGALPSKPVVVEEPPVQLPPNPTKAADDAVAAAEEAAAAAEAEAEAEADSDSDAEKIRRHPKVRPFRPAPYRQRSLRRIEASATFMTRAYSLQELEACPWRKEEALNLMNNNVSVDYGKGGPDAQLSKSFKTGLELPHGWLITARATADYELSVWVDRADGGRRLQTVKVPKDEMVGVLLVAANKKDWKGNARDGQSADVVALAVHQHFQGNYVPNDLWKELLIAVREDDDTKTGKFTLNVQGGPCLNNERSRKLYREWGFRGVSEAARGDSIQGWSATFTDGVPPPPPVAAV